MYWVLECYGPSGEEPAQLEPAETGVESWMTGHPFAPPPPEPIALWWEAETETGPRLPLYDAGPVLMRRELVDSLRSAGVDNLDCYETVIRSRSGSDEDRGYLAVNVVGVVAAADMERSGARVEEGEAAILDVDFDGLVIDEARAAGFLLMRLGECVSALLVHDRVRRILDADPRFELDFIDPAEWSG